MSSHIETGLTRLWLAQKESLPGTSVSVMKPRTVFLTEEQLGHLWGRSSTELSALGRNHMEERGRAIYLAGHADTEGEEGQVMCLCCPNATLSFPVAVAFHFTGSQVPAPFPWFVSNLIDFKHPEMSYADFLWERIRRRTCLQSCYQKAIKCVGWKLPLAGNTLKRKTFVSCSGN